MALLMHTTYNVINLKNNRQKYTVRTAIEKSPSSRLVAFDTSVSEPLDEARLKQAQKEDSLYYFYDEDVMLNPRSGPPLGVATTRGIIYPENWHYVLDILETTVGVEVEFSSAARFEWDVDFGARQECHCSINSKSCTSVFLPGQFIKVAWKRKVQQ